MPRFATLFALASYVSLGLAACADPPATEDAEPVELAPERPARPAAPSTPTPSAGLLNPPAQDMRAPDEYVAELETPEGTIQIEVHRDWAPRGADRFYTLIRLGYYDDVAFFRVVSGFMAQVGIHGEPSVNAVWRPRRIQDDPVVQSNTRGMVSFATSGPNSRTTQFFINFVDNSRLDGMGFSPFGKVLDMTPVDALYSGYGEGAPRGRGPDQGRMQSVGNSYLRASFPELDYITSARIVER